MNDKGFVVGRIEQLTTEPSAVGLSAVERRVSNPTVAELTKNMRRNIRHMHADLKPGNDRDSRLIDYLNHMDDIAQQIETELGC